MNAKSSERPCFKSGHLGRMVVGLGLVVAVAAIPERPVHAEGAKNDATAQALRKAQGLLRDISQQKTQLETENAGLKEQVKKLEATVKQLEPLEGEVARFKASAEQLQGNAAALESQLGSERERVHKWQERHEQTVAQAKKIQADNLVLVSAVKEREQWITQCGDNNKGLLSANRELLDKYKQKGFWDKLAEVEPFTGIGKVKTENAEQEFKFKLEDLQVTPYKDESKSAAEPASAQEQPAEDDGE